MSDAKRESAPPPGSNEPTQRPRGPSSVRTVVVLVSVVAAAMIARTCLRRPAESTRGGEAEREPERTATAALGERESSARAAPSASGAGPRAGALAQDGDAGAGANVGDGGARSVSTGPEREWFRARWGGGERDLGHDLPSEANAEGPMGLATTRDGRTWVLDQVNARLMRVTRDGRVDTRSHVELRAAQDVATGPDGSLAVLDRLGDRAIALYDSDGNSRGRIPLTSLVGETGGVTGVFVERDGVYVEREHGPLVRVADEEGHAIEGDAGAGDELPGRPTRDGRSYVAVALADRVTGRLALTTWDRATRAHRYTRVIPLGSAVRNLVLLDSDRAGVVYLAALGAFGAGDAATGERGLAVKLVCVESVSGRVLGQNTMPESEGPEEVFREFSVLDDGGVLYLRRTGEGAVVEAWNCH